MDKQMIEQTHDCRVYELSESDGTRAIVLLRRNGRKEYEIGVWFGAPANLLITLYRTTERVQAILMYQAECTRAELAHQSVVLEAAYEAMKRRERQEETWIETIRALRRELRDHGVTVSLIAADEGVIEVRYERVRSAAHTMPDWMLRTRTTTLGLLHLTLQDELGTWKEYAALVKRGVNLDAS